jgi:hypothetical protein
MRPGRFSFNFILENGNLPKEERHNYSIMKGLARLAMNLLGDTERLMKFTE